MTDPFADAPVTNETPQTNDFPEAPIQNNNAPATKSGDDNKVRVTLKGGTGYDAPWITIDGTDVPDTLAQMKDYANELKELLDVAAKVGNYFPRSVAADKEKNKENNGGTPKAPQNAGNGGQAPQQQESKPPQQQAPNGEQQFCAHGEMQWKSWVRESDGKAFKGFFCTERNRDQQCKPQFRK